MCLFLGGMGMGNQEPPFPLTEKARNMTRTLQIVSLVHFTLVLIVMFTAPTGATSFTMLITPLILCCATCSYQYYCLMFYIFYAIIDFFGFVEPCGVNI
jgi:hypothetical protein